MLRRSERNLENIPVGALGLITVPGCEELGEKVNKIGRASCRERVLCSV